MIRRQTQCDGIDAWVLVAQADHARLAGQLAEHWYSPEFPPLEPRTKLVWAIHHHDDGWLEWDASPGIDPANGRPRSFTEMELADALSIWRRSIDVAAQAGPLEGFLVAGHFSTLLRRFGTWRGDAVREPMANAFLSEQNANSLRWLADWHARDRANTPAVAQRALEYLQFFDALSLWLCCTPTGEDAELSLGDKPALHLVPQDAGHIRLDPWPFQGEQELFTAVGRQVPATIYTSREALAAAPEKYVVLNWLLEPA